MKPHFLLFSQARSVPPSGVPTSGVPTSGVPTSGVPTSGVPTSQDSASGAGPAAGVEISLADPDLADQGGWWHFLLESMDGGQRLEAEDYEVQWGGERLELLAVVRGLEALEQPSRVILVTPSRYVHRGLRFGLSPWRDNHWLWERFGELAPVKNADLWQRVDRALEFHRLECRLWRLDNEPARDDRSVVPRPHFRRRRQTVPRESSPSGISGWLATAREAVEQWTAAASNPTGRRCVAAGH